MMRPGAFLTILCSLALCCVAVCGLEGEANDPQECKSGQFRCLRSRRCIPKEWVCDGENDCGDDDDLSDEDERCQKKVACLWNHIQCSNSSTCILVSSLCDSNEDCPDGSDEGSFCNHTTCSRLNCSYGCQESSTGPICYCEMGKRANGTSCIDVDECEVDGICDQKCANTNVPEDELPTLISSSSDDIQHLYLNGTTFPGGSVLPQKQILALDFDHRNRSVCYIHLSDSSGPSILSCSPVKNLQESWDLPTPSIFSLSSAMHISLDWVSGNWYFLDDEREVIFLCNSTLEACAIVVEGDLSKPRDPTKGYMFFTLWGNSPSRLERSRLDGEERTTLVQHKIIYPYGVTVDFPAQHVYWVETYLDVVERVNYDGTNRKTVKRGFPVQNLYDITVFENNLFMTSWRNNSIIRVNKFDSDDHESIPLPSRPFHIQVYHRQRQPDVPHPCHNSNGLCEHLCIPTWKPTLVAVPQCLCKPGYKLAEDGHSCSRTKLHKFLIFGKGKPAMIKGLPMTPGEKEQVIVPITNVIRPVALDYDVQSSYIYYSDSQRFVIGRQHIDGTEDEIVIKDVQNCHGLAVDWAGRNLYWTDSGLSTINVVRLDDFKRRKVLVQEPYMDPRSIVVDPQDGLMYWADWPIAADRTAKIMRAWMDGTNQVIFVSHPMKLPSGLTIDSANKKLYWCDVTTTGIWSMTLDKRVVVSDDALKHPLGLAVHDGALFWTDTDTGEVMRYDVANRTLSTLSVENTPLYDLKVVDNSSQNGTNGCSVNYGGCPDLCLATPDGKECACRTGYDKNNTDCVPQPDYVPPSKCKPEHFQCVKTGRCIERRYLCKKKDQFRCDVNRCISKTWVCDGDGDCGDGTDEDTILCANTTCNSLQYTCKQSGHCIPKTWMCDHEYDCGKGDKSDEGEICDYPKCDREHFQCANNRCIPFEFLCDLSDDCGDASDEVGCLQSCKSESEFYCAAEDKCLPNSKRCNGHKDCSDGSDEFICTGNATRRLCGRLEFQCDNGVCIRKKFICDGQNDCVDGSDEKGCNNTLNSTTPLPTTLKKILPENCLHPSLLCDGGVTCVPVDRLCDGHHDCADRSDEGGLCDDKMCAYRSDCSHHCHDSPQGFVCWCPESLYLQTDGLTCGISHPCSSWGACSQVCEQHGTRHKCSCEPGYVLQSDYYTCKSNDSATPYVVFSNRHELRSVDLHTFNVKALIMSLKNTIALDFYYTKNTIWIFWTDVIDDKIYRGTLITLSNIEVVVQTGLSTAEGLAVDWIGENLYWVESNLDQIEVARLDGKYRRTLIASDLESPRAIALDPRYGLLFWTDWDVNSPRIERCSMSGQYRKTVVNVDILTDGAWPNGLTLDYALKRIYWIDAKSDSIHTTTYDGDDHHEVMREHETLTHPFAIALFGNYVYWTDWRTNAVIRGNKWNGSDISVIQRTLTQPFDIQIMHPSRQPRG
ncbi:LOW QUALITY PROTEIN: Putative vitellogenin receptor, partial [Gryllus bimaculatus]